MQIEQKPEAEAKAESCSSCHRHLPHTPVPWHPADWTLQSAHFWKIHSWIYFPGHFAGVPGIHIHENHVLRYSSRENEKGREEGEEEIGVIQKAS